MTSTTDQKSLAPENDEAMKGIVEGVLKETEEGGSVRMYFKSQGSEKPEGALRRGFAELMEDARTDQASWRKRARELLRALDIQYKTQIRRWKGEEGLETCAEVIQEGLEHGGLSELLKSGSPKLFPSSEEEAGRALKCDRDVQEVLHETRERMNHYRPYSFVTKILHFCFPETFAIYDLQSAVSIRTWSWFAYNSRAGENSEDPLKEWDVGRIGDPSGAGYRKVLEFYQMFWCAASAQEQKELSGRAEKMGGLIDADVSTVDLLDKLLWKANGDPLILGLR